MAMTIYGCAIFLLVGFLSSNAEGSSDIFGADLYDEPGKLHQLNKRYTYGAEYYAEPKKVDYGQQRSTYGAQSAYAATAGAEGYTAEQARSAAAAAAVASAAAADAAGYAAEPENPPHEEQERAAFGAAVVAAAPAAEAAAFGAEPESAPHAEQQQRAAYAAEAAFGAEPGYGAEAAYAGEPENPHGEQERALYVSDYFAEPHHKHNTEQSRAYAGADYFAEAEKLTAEQKRYNPAYAPEHHGHEHHRRKVLGRRTYVIEDPVKLLHRAHQYYHHKKRSGAESRYGEPSAYEIKRLITNYYAAARALQDNLPPLEPPKKAYRYRRVYSAY